MPRINLEDKLWDDARFVYLTEKIGMTKAIGSVVRAWKMAQRSILNGRKTIKHEEWKFAELDILIDAGLAEKLDEGVYIKGSSEYFSWLTIRKETGKLGGLAKASKRKQTLANASKRKQTVPSTSSSSSSSSSDSDSASDSDFVSKTGRGPSRRASPNGVAKQEVIAFYAEKYKKRFGVNPVITGKESGAVTSLLKSLSVHESQGVIEDYFELSDAWIVQRMYPLSVLQEASVINRIKAKREGIDVTRSKAFEYEKVTDIKNIINKMFPEEK